jgi:hypothetical protein
MRLKIVQAERLPQYRIIFTKKRALALNILLAICFFISGFLVPEFIDWPVSFIALVATLFISLFILKMLVFEVRSRQFFSAAAASQGERLGNQNWAKLYYTLVLLSLCCMMFFIQIYFQFGLRNDLRSKLPFVGKLFATEVDDLRSFIQNPESGAASRVLGELPRALILRKSIVAQAENGLYVWPAQLDSQNKLSFLQTKAKESKDTKETKETRAWIDIAASGDIPEFRFDPDVLVSSGKIYIWGGSADDDTVSSLKRRPYKGGSVFDLRTRVWSNLPAIPDANLLRSSRIMLMGTSVVLVSLNYDKTSNAFVSSFVLSDDSKTWRPFKSVSLQNFNAVEIYTEKGLVVVVGELGQEGDGMLKSVNKVASSVKEVLEIGTFQERIQVSNDSSARFRVYDFSGTAVVRTPGTKPEPPLLDLPQGLNGAMIVAHSPGLLFLKGADEELLICRFRPFECPRLVNSVGANIKAGARKSMGGRIYGDSVYFWQSDRFDFQEYNFETRSLVTSALNDQARKAIPLYVFQNGHVLFGQTSGQDTLAEAEFKTEIREVACRFLPFRAQVKPCAQSKARLLQGSL